MLACWQNLWSVSLALIRHQKTHARAQFPDNRTLVTSFYGFCCSKVICASFKLNTFAMRLCLMETWFYSMDYSTGKVFPGRTGQQGPILPAVVCLPVLCCAALGTIPSTANRENSFLPRHNSSEQVWEEKNHCRHLELGRVNPMLRVWCCSGANINVRNEKLWAVPEEWIPACSCFLCPFLCCWQGNEMLRWWAGCQIQELGESKTNTPGTHSLWILRLSGALKYILPVPGNPLLHRCVVGHWEKIR